MNKRLLWIPVVIGVVAWILIPGKPPMAKGMKFTMKTPDCTSRSEALKDVGLYLDNSGSMKGYVDLSGSADPEFTEARASMVGTLSSLLNNINKEFDLEAVVECGGKTYDRNQFRTRLADHSIFSGAVTELDKMIEKVCTHCSDSTVSIIVSDMVLSYGRNKIDKEKDLNYNLHHLEELSAAVHSSLIKVGKLGLQVALIQYLSDFNGRYYYNYHENKDTGSEFKGQRMAKRPYYLLVIGREAMIDLLLKNCIDGYDGLYTTCKIHLSGEQPFTVTADGNSAWIVGDPANPHLPGCIYTDTDLGEVQGSFLFSCSRFQLPAFVDKKKVWENLDFDKSVIASVAYAGENQGNLSYRVIFQPWKNLKEGNSVSYIRLLHTSSLTNASIENDVKVDKKELEGKTWGLSAILKAIDKAYPQRDTIVAQFDFTVVK